MVFKKNDKYRTFDESGKLIKEESESSLGKFKNVKDNSMHFTKDNTTRVFDKHFKKLSDKHV